MPLPCGRYLYEVSSGRIIAGPKTYLKGERFWLSEEQALSLKDSGQIKFLRTAPSKAKAPRRLVPGETLLRMSQNEMKRIPRKDLKRMAQNEFGLILERESVSIWIEKIEERRHHVLQRPRRSRKTSAGKHVDQSVE